MIALVVGCMIYGYTYQRDHQPSHDGENIKASRPHVTVTVSRDTSDAPIQELAHDGHHVGYVTKDMTDEIRENAILPCQCYCYIGNNDGTFYSDCYILCK